MNPIHITGWTLVHSVWEFAAIGLALLVARLLTTSARFRYAFGLTALIACPIASVVTAFLLGGSGQLPAAMPKGPSQPVALPAEATPAFVSPISHVSSPLAQSHGMETTLPWLVLLWEIGLVLMSLRFLHGLFAIRKLDNRSIPNSDERITSIVTGLAQRFGYRRPISVKVSEKIESPATIGFLKAVILLPTSVLSGLNPEHLEAIIAHEIAHIKRYDYLLNLVQSLLETVFFYHPAIWWISATMRTERENRCDDLAVEVLGDRSRYTRSLVLLEEMRLGSPKLAVAATGGTLLGRIRRLVSGTQRPTNAGWIYAVVATVALVSIGYAQIQSRKPKTEATSDEVALRGQVIGLDGRPAKGAIVQAIVEDNGHDRWRIVTAISGETGEFDFHMKSKLDQVFAYLNDTGFALVSLRTGAVQLEKLKPVTVKTLDASGHPIPGVNVAPWAVATKGGGIQLGPEIQNRMKAKSGVDGEAHLLLPTGTSNLDILSDNYAIEPPSRTSIDASKGDKATLVLGKAASVDGVVVENGKPLAGVGVNAMTQNYLFKSTQTDTQGRFHLASLPKGMVRIETSLPLALQTEGCNALQFLQLSPGNSQKIRLEIKPGVAVKGKVTDAKGQVAADATLQVIRYSPAEGFLASPATPITLDSSGSFSTRLPAGSYRAQVWRSRTSSDSSFRVKEGQPVNLSLVAPEKPRQIKATVYGSDGKPVGQMVQIDYSYRDQAGVEHRTGTYTQPDGTSTIDVPESATNIFFTASNRDEFSDWQVRPHDGTVALKLKKVPLVSVTGKVVDAQGRPVKGAVVQLGFDSDVRFQGDGNQLAPRHLTKEDGTYQFNGVYPGTRASAMIEGKGFARTMTKETRIEGNPQVMPTAQLAPVRAMRGRVIDSKGKPVRNAQVIPESNGWTSGPEPRTDENGRFKVDYLPPQKLLFRVFQGYKESSFREKDGVEPTYVVKG